VTAQRDGERFALDANVFVEAHRRYYAFDLAPGFWDALVEHCRGGRLCSVDRVLEELAAGRDALSEWAVRHHELFKSTDETVVFQHYAEIMTWVDAQRQFFDAAKASFASGADGWLVAFAKVHKMTVVTLEQFAPEVRKTVPIPNICAAFSVPYTDTFQMLRRLGVRLI
jgi:predicted nucleic acid-binding protein